MDSEDLQGIIDDNREDFLNNTTVVVFQEFHNNTTVVNQYSNNTTHNMDQSGTSTSSTTYNYNGTAQEAEMFVYRKEWSISDIMPEITPKRDRNFTVEYSYYDYPTNDDRTDTFTLPCSNYYDAPEPGGNSTTNPTYWNDNDWYWEWWDAIYNNTIRDLLNEVAYWDSVEDSCREQDGYLYDFEDNFEDAPIIFELDLPNGTALHVVQIKRTHSYTNNDGESRMSGTYDWAVNGIRENQVTYSFLYHEFCPILRWYYGYDDGTCGDYYGGWEDLHLTFQWTGWAYADSTFSFTIHYELIPVNYSA